MNNRAFGGYGDNLYMQRFRGKLTLNKLNLQSFYNSIYLEDGDDLQATNIKMVWKDISETYSELNTTGIPYPNYTDIDALNRRESDKMLLKAIRRKA